MNPISNGRFEVRSDYQGNTEDPFSGLPIDGISEARFDFTPYLFCNESVSDEILSQINNYPTNDDGIHLGFACWFNYDIIALRKPQLAIVCDINKQQLEMYEKIRETVKNCLSPVEFINVFKSQIEKKEDPQLVEKLERELTRCNGWLSDEENYRTVRRMFIEGKIFHGALNACERSGMFQKIQDWCSLKNLHFDTIYTSNIQEWAKKEGSHNLEAFRNNLTCLLSDNTLYIDSYALEEKNKGVLKQRISIGNEIPELPIRQRKKTKSIEKRVIPRKLF